MSSFLSSIQLEPDQHAKLVMLSDDSQSVVQKVERFVRGPIPAEWLEQAARLPGKALHAAMAIRYLDGFERSGTIKLRPSVRNAYGMDRFSCARALEQLEAAGLITVARKPGAAPTVILLAGAKWADAGSRVQ